MEKSKCQCSSSWSSIRGEQQKIEWWEWGRLGWGRSQLNLKWGPTIFIFHIFSWFSKSLTISFNFQSLSQFLLVFNIFHNFPWLYSFFTIFFIFNLSNNFFWFLQTLLIFANFKCSLWFLSPLTFTILTALFPFPDSNLKDFYVFIFHWLYHFVWDINLCKTLFFVTKTASLFTTMMTICDCDEECELCMWQRWGFWTCPCLSPSWRWGPVVTKMEELSCGFCIFARGQAIRPEYELPLGYCQLCDQHHHLRSMKNTLAEINRECEKSISWWHRPMSSRYWQSK